jgi:Zn2+/Cd2+-exporting ATPase
MQRYVLRNLDCADCAVKIEDQLKNTRGVTFAVVNFATATLTIKADDLNIVKETIQQIEPQVELLRQGENAGGQTNMRRELIRMGISIPLFLIGLLFYDRLHDSPYHLAEYAILLPAYLLSGWTVLSGAIRNIRRGRIFDEYFLMTVATVGAWLIHETPEAVGVMIFYMVGEFLQGLSVDRSRRSIRSLLAVRPDTANLLRAGRVERVHAEVIDVGQKILINPGERVPLDGVVVDGLAIMDTSALTGESMPVPIQTGDEVLAGMVNQTEMLTIKVIRPYDQSAIARILHLVEAATNRKASTEKFITRFARVYSPVVVGIAALVALVPPLVIPGATFSDWFYRALVVLVISCPCALVVSIPLSYFAGVGAASRRGILVKGSNYLDILADVRTLIFDKTGTLTQGAFEVVEIHPHLGQTQDELLTLAAQADAQSNHPIARSIRAAYIKQTKTGEAHLLVPELYEATPGRGVRVVNGEDELLLGSSAFLSDRGFPHPEVETHGSAVHLVRNGDYMGYLIVSDSLKADAVAAIQDVRRLGIERIIMLTGDKPEIAANVAEQLGIIEYKAGLLPEDKVSALEASIAIGEQPGKVGFVGDGINDAPVIARSDVGIAMGGIGSEAAIESADVVIMGDSLTKIAEAIRLGRRTRSIVWQNILFALAVKGGFIALGIGGRATMWEAVFADMGVALLAILNAIRVVR